MLLKLFKKLPIPVQIICFFLALIVGLVVFGFVFSFLEEHSGDEFLTPNFKKRKIDFGMSKAQIEEVWGRGPDVVVRDEDKEFEFNVYFGSARTPKDILVENMAVNLQSAVETYSSFWAYEALIHKDDGLVAWAQRADDVIHSEEYGFEDWGRCIQYMAGRYKKDE